MRLHLIFVTLLSLLFTLSHVQAKSVTPADIKPQILPVDTDEDGVIDDFDKCYKTPLGIKVDERGCEIISIEAKDIRLNIKFDVNSAILKPEYYAEVERVAVFMHQHPGTRVLIEGHTDSDGSAEYNKRLSSQRAQAAGRVLVSVFGIAANRVTALGVGEERPLVENNTDSNKALNRRVVALIRSVKESSTTKNKLQ